MVVVDEAYVEQIKRFRCYLGALAKGGTLLTYLIQGSWVAIEIDAVILIPMRIYKSNGYRW